MTTYMYPNIGKKYVKDMMKFKLCIFTVCSSIFGIIANNNNVYATLLFLNSALLSFTTLLFIEFYLEIQFIRIWKSKIYLIGNIIFISYVGASAVLSFSLLKCICTRECSNLYYLSVNTALALSVCLFSIFKI